MSIAELTADAEEKRRLRQDNSALQCALERAVADRDNWRKQATDVAVEFQDFKAALLRLMRETRHV